MKTKRKSAKENKFCPKIPAQADLRKIKFAQTENAPPPLPQPIIFLMVCAFYHIKFNFA
jgi:hypothetical protein